MRQEESGGAETDGEAWGTANRVRAGGGRSNVRPDEAERGEEGMEGCDQ